jgi:formamidopyrimidine-DNA glycosylase
VPELPDVAVYVDALERTILGRRLERIRLVSPFVLRSVEPPLSAVEGRTMTSAARIGKRLVMGFEDDFFLVIHLMIAGRLRWRARKPGASPPALHRKLSLAAFDFEHGSVLFSEAGPRRRASLHVVHGRGGLDAHDPGGLEVLGSTVDAFSEALKRENHTVKRSLTDPRIVSGIGNAYSDEILHRARLSPLKQTRHLAPDEIARLHAAVHAVMTEWVARLSAAVGEGFPDKVTAFHDEMAVHGRYGKPCPVCGHPVQRIVFAENEANYCATCQTGGRLLADRAMSRLLREDWPATLEEWEDRKKEGT